MTVTMKSWLIQHWLTLIRLVSMMCFNYKAMPTNDTDHKCHIKPVELVNQSYELNIMPNHATSY